MKPYSKKCTTEIQKGTQRLLRSALRELWKVEHINDSEFTEAWYHQQHAAMMALYRRQIEILKAANSDSECIEASHQVVDLIEVYRREWGERRPLLH